MYVDAHRTLVQREGRMPWCSGSQPQSAMYQACAVGGAWRWHHLRRIAVRRILAYSSQNTSLLRHPGLHSLLQGRCTHKEQGGTRSTVEGTALRNVR